MSSLSAPLSGTGDVSARSVGTSGGGMARIRSLNPYGERMRSRIYKTNSARESVRRTEDALGCHRCSAPRSGTGDVSTRKRRNELARVRSLNPCGERVRVKYTKRTPRSAERRRRGGGRARMASLSSPRSGTGDVPARSDGTKRGIFTFFSRARSRHLPRVWARAFRARVRSRRGAR